MGNKPILNDAIKEIMNDIQMKNGGQPVSLNQIIDGLIDKTSFDARAVPTKGQIAAAILREPELKDIKFVGRIRHNLMYGSFYSMKSEAPEVDA